jgi:hypothetical protein
MPDQRFDPSQAVTFDLSHGLVLVEGLAERVLAPAAALAALCKAGGPEACAAFGRAMGQDVGRRAGYRIAREGEGPIEDAVRAASLERVTQHLGDEVALAGLGSLALERWGQALVLVVDRSPLGAEGDALVAAVLEGALAEATGRSPTVRPLARDGARARFLVSSTAAAERVAAWLAAGTSWGDALVRLHGEGAATSRGDA